MTANAGGRIFASQINALTGLYARKTANQTITSSTTLTNDTQLVVPVAANNSYSFDLEVWYNGAGPGTGDLKYFFTIPAGATFIAAQLAIANPIALTMGQFTNASAAQITFCNGTGNPFPVRVWGTLVVGATAGNFQYQWAENTSNGTGTTVQSGSTLNLVNNT
jgi:hypothetical protein